MPKTHLSEATRLCSQVSIDTYDPVQRQLSGFMAAHGITVASRTDVPISAHAPTTKSDITTFFTGQILHPILDGIFTIPAPSRINLAAGGWPCKSRLTRSHEADGWVQVGPFKGMKSAELLEKGKDRQWIQEVSKGWVLCRWKEKEFINVAGTQSPVPVVGAREAFPGFLADPCCFLVPGTVYSERRSALHLGTLPSRPRPPNRIPRRPVHRPVCGAATATRPLASDRRVWRDRLWRLRLSLMHAKDIDEQPLLRSTCSLALSTTHVQASAVSYRTHSLPSHLLSSPCNVFPHPYLFSTLLAGSTWPVDSGGLCLGEDEDRALSGGGRTTRGHPGDRLFRVFCHSPLVSRRTNSA